MNNLNSQSYQSPAQQTSRSTLPGSLVGFTKINDVLPLTVPTTSVPSSYVFSSVSSSNTQRYVPSIASVGSEVSSNDQNKMYSRSNNVGLNNIYSKPLPSRILPSRRNQTGSNLITTDAPIINDSDFRDSEIMPRLSVRYSSGASSLSTGSQQDNYDRRRYSNINSSFRPNNIMNNGDLSLDINEYGIENQNNLDTLALQLPQKLVLVESNNSRRLTPLPSDITEAVTIEQIRNPAIQPIKTTVTPSLFDLYSGTETPKLIPLAQINQNELSYDNSRRQDQIDQINQQLEELYFPSIGKKSDINALVASPSELMLLGEDNYQISVQLIPKNELSLLS